MYVLAPYERVAGGTGRPVRQCSLGRILPRQIPGGPEPFVESEGLGGYAVAMILDPGHLATAAAAPGVLAMPEIPLTARLSDISTARRNELRDAMLAQGFTVEDLRAALGDDLSAASLLAVLRFMCSTRRKPRFDAAGDRFLVDGPLVPTRPLPLPPISGGAFPTTGILDDFNRANAGPPPSSSWTTAVQSAGDSGLEVVSNTCRPDAAFASMYWNAATFGPDMESHMVMSTWGSIAFNEVNIYVRLQGPFGGTVDGYSLIIQTFDDGLQIVRIDDSANTTLGSPITQNFDDGDSIGIEVIGDDISAYRKAGGSWSSALGTRTDTNYPGGGRVGLYVDKATSILDDYGGGTVVTGPPPTPPTLNIVRSPVWRVR